MIPILFEANETAFANNGIGRLRDCIECTVVEGRNEVFECDFVYPVNGANYDKIICGRFVGVTHDEGGDIQPFEIVGMTRPINGLVTFHAVHLSYRQSQIVASGTNINNLSGAFSMLESATPSNPFTYETDITSTAWMSSADGTPRSVRQFLGGVQGSILDAFGGEYEWDKWRVILHSQRGEAKDFAIRYGVNLLDYNEDTSYQGTFTSCVAYWKSEDGTVVTATASLNETGYNGNDIRIALDLTDKFEDEPTSVELEAMALSYMENNQTNVPTRSISVDFVRLSEMGEFSAFQDLLKCKLCDTIKVIFPMYNVEANFKIVKTVWNVLRGSYDSMELGKLSTTLSEALGIGETTSTSSGSGGSGADYITEEGTEGIWTWRKWSSGIAECWGTATNSSQTASTAWGNIYYGTFSSITFPNGLFNAAPTLVTTCRSVGGRFWLSQSNDVTASSAGTIYVLAPQSYTTGAYCAVNLYAKGTSSSLNRDVHIEQVGDVLILS